MKKLQQKQRIAKKMKLNSKILKTKLEIPIKGAPLPALKALESPKKPSIARKPAIQAESKLPGIQNFWNPEVKKEIKRSAVVLDGEDETKDNKKQRLTGAERYQRYMDEEERIRKIEDELADSNLDPHTPDQFERALMKDRNSSFIWIKYMAFHLETAETEKARTVAKKAIASINFREEGELLNVWMALLNLEIRYGSDETYNEILREAVQRNDAFKVYTRNLTVLLEIEKFEEAGKIIEVLKKKFKPNPEMWLQVSEAYLKMKNEKMAKEMLPKSLLSLKEKHRKFQSNIRKIGNY
jgi:rRNA biogenesis protein RRP5